MLQIKVNNTNMQFEPINGSVMLNGVTVNADVAKLGKGKYHIILNNASYTVELLGKDETGKNLQLMVNGQKQLVSVTDKYDKLLQQLGLDKLMGKKANVVKAPMPGLVLRLMVEPNQAVKKGDALLVLEAMKMENVIKADGDGVVKEIMVKERQPVEKNVVLISMHD